MNKKIPLISIIGTVLVLIIAIVLCTVIDLNHKNKNDDKKAIGYDRYIENEEKLNVEMTKNLEYKDYILQDGNILVEMNNKNDYPAYAKIYVELLDGDNNLVAIEDNIESLSPGQKGYQKIYINDELKELYETHNTKVVLEYDSIQEKDLSKYIKNIKFDDKNKEFSFTSNKNIEHTEFGIIYYDNNNKIIDYDTELVLNIKANKKNIKNIYTSNKEYNKIEIVLLNAYNY